MLLGKKRKKKERLARRKLVFQDTVITTGTPMSLQEKAKVLSKQKINSQRGYGYSAVPFLNGWGEGFSTCSSILVLLKK